MRFSLKIGKKKRINSLKIQSFLYWHKNCKTCFFCLNQKKKKNSENIFLKLAYQNDFAYVLWNMSKIQKFDIF
jgi:hypothetical protein